MFNIIESHSIGKDPNLPSEDKVVVTDSFVSVIDGATPKTAFRFPNHETPGHYAARILATAIKELPIDVDAYTCARILNEAIHTDLPPADSPIASVVIYSDFRKEVWQIGDCQWASMNVNDNFTTHRNDKQIDRQLANWRSVMLQSMIARNVITPEQALVSDPARKIIQPFITRQVRYQNTTGSPLCFGVIDGTQTPDEYIHIYNIGEQTRAIILASDGYPYLCPTLAQSEEQLKEVLQQDSLCISRNPQTKGIRSGCTSFDDRTFIKIDIL